MTDTYNIYCDESCHLENDRKPIMAISAIWCPIEKTKQISKEIRGIKTKHGLSKNLEIKWTKVSPAKIQFYQAIVDYFFDQPDLHFRTILIKKDTLDHQEHRQTHDEWYYKMCFVLLKEIIDPVNSYRIYIDIKDTRSETKRSKLEEILKNAKYDPSGEIIEKVQQICSRESEIMQLADLLMGAVRYFTEYNVTVKSKSKAKNDLINHIISRSRLTLLENTWPKESKFNIFHWKGKGEK
jgi:hypothetical protein